MVAPSSVPSSPPAHRSSRYFDASGRRDDASLRTSARSGSVSWSRRPRRLPRQSAELRDARHAEAAVMSVAARRLRREDGVAMVLVVFGVALLATLSVVLIDTVSSESARSAKAVSSSRRSRPPRPGSTTTSRSSRTIARYYLHWVHPAESTRRDDGSGGRARSSRRAGRRRLRAPGVAIRRRNRRPSPGPTARRGSPTRAGKITGAASGTATSTTCRSRRRAPRRRVSRSSRPGGRISNPADTRVIEAVVRQSIDHRLPGDRRRERRLGLGRDVVRDDLLEREHRPRRNGVRQQSTRPAR